MQKTYCTLGRVAECEIIINRSRFIGQAFPIIDEEQAMEYIQQVRERFPDASHHCYAYLLGRGSNIQRFSDDGEPGGTAGMPILQVIQQQEVEDALVIVTRYFGGVKLGSGGLVRAYSKSATEVMAKSHKKTMTLSSRGIICLEYSLLGTVEHFLRQKGILMVNADYQERVTLTIMTPMDWEDFCTMIIEVCNGRVQCEHLDEVYYHWSHI